MEPKWRRFLDLARETECWPELVAGSLAFVGLVLLAAPGVHWLDAGQLTAGAFHLSPAHAPGEPVYVTLTKGFSLLPFGSIAFRANLGSSFAGALIAVCVALFVRRALAAHLEVSPLERGVLAVGAAMGVVCSYPLLIQSVRAEVYALHLLLALTSWLAAFRAGVLRGGPLSSRYVAMSAFLAGLDFGVHTLLAVLAFLPVLTLALARVRGQSARTATSAAWAGLLGCSSYLLLPIRASVHGGFGWGEASHLEGFLDVLLARTFQHNFSPLTLPLLMQNLRIVGGVILNGVGPGGLMIAGVGVLAMVLRRQVRAVAFVLVAVASNLLSILPQNKVFHDNPDLAGYLALHSVLVYVLGAFGAAFVLTRLSSRLAVARFCTLGAFVFLVGFSVAPGLEGGDRSHDRLPESHAEAALRGLSPGSLLLVSGNDTMFLLQYLQDVELARPDVTMLPRALLTHPWYRKRRHVPEPVSAAVLEGLDSFLPYASGRAVRVELRERDLLAAARLCPSPEPGWGFYEVAPCPWLEDAQPRALSGLLLEEGAYRGPQAVSVGLNAASFLIDYYRARGKETWADALSQEVRARVPEVAFSTSSSAEEP